MVNSGELSEEGDVEVPSDDNTDCLSDSASDISSPDGMKWMKRMLLL